MKNWIYLKDTIETYLKSVKKLCPKITDEELVYFKSGLTITELEPKYFYIQAGVLQKEVGYVHSGLLRVFYIDDKGNEITVNFTREGNYASHYSTFGTQKPSKFYFQCIEPSIIINLSYTHIQNCYDKYPIFERYIRLIVEEAHSNLISRMEGFLFDNAKTRYLNFMTENPDLYNRVSLTDLCTYLGIERQSLTRIRKKLLQK